MGLVRTETPPQLLFHLKEHSWAAVSMEMKLNFMVSKV